jgi:hypothetical protein
LKEEVNCLNSVLEDLSFAKNSVHGKETCWKVMRVANKHLRAATTSAKLVALLTGNSQHPFLNAIDKNFISCYHHPLPP